MRGGFEIQENNGDGLLTITREKTSVFGNNPILPAVSFAFKVHDVEGLQNHINNRKLREEAWQKKLEQDTMILKNESHTYRDVVFVNTVEVYRSLPAKLLAFYKWVDDHDDIKYVLKTDDDCYLDVEKILHKLDGLKERTNLWWGNFRYYWPLDATGKWQETKYQASSYPPFACGSGYLVSRDVAHWLAMNADYLSHYQGEDVSLAIWLAAVAPNIIQDDEWGCDKTCRPNMLSQPDLFPEELNHTWNNKLQCGNPCACG